jgi:uncharacterized protein (TIGR03435 family)
MRRSRILLCVVFCISLCAVFCVPPAFAQSAASQTNTPPSKFEMADVHVGPPTLLGVEGGPMREGRFAMCHATMLDLISAAWGVQADKVVDGPNWLNLDRFDVIAQAAPLTSPAAMRTMLRPLLAERLGLKVHEDRRPMPAFVLTAGKHPLLQETDGSEDTNCRWRYLTAEQKAASRPVFACRNISMDEFAAKLSSGIASDYVDEPVTNETGLEGKWDFSFSWTNTWQMITSGDGVTLFQAIEKQLGLKLEPRDAPTDVLVVDSVDRAPTANAPGVAEKLSPASREFEVASVRPSEPGEAWRSDIEPGGRLVIRAGTLYSLLHGAWVIRSDDMVAGVPAWLDQDKFDIVAKMPASLQAVGTDYALVDLPAARQMWQSLLRDRFGMVWHYEDRPANVFAMVSDKPKLKKADPQARSDCKLRTMSQDGRPQFAFECRNMTMDQLAAKMRQMMATFDLNHPAINSTGIEGGWDFTVTWTPPPPTASAATADGGQGAGSAPDPTGTVTFAEALDKELGLKLEVQKHVITVLVIDRINRTPTDN